MTKLLTIGDCADAYNVLSTDPADYFFNRYATTKFNERLIDVFEKLFGIPHLLTDTVFEKIKTEDRGTNFEQDMAVYLGKVCSGINDIFHGANTLKPQGTMSITATSHDSDFKPIREVHKISTDLPAENIGEHVVEILQRCWQAGLDPVKDRVSLTITFG